MRRAAWVVAWAAACGGTEPEPEPALPTDECLARLVDDAPRSELRLHGAGVLDDGATVGFDYAPQGGLYTPFEAWFWGSPELSAEPAVAPTSDGLVQAAWDVVDPADGYVLATREGSRYLSCVADDDGGAHLVLGFDVEYFGEDGTTHSGMTTEELEGLEVDLTLRAGPHPASGGGSTQWGGGTYTTSPVTYTVTIERTLSLTQGLPD
jgi:hypothetical protein